MAEPLALVLKGSDEIVVYACSVCRIVASTETGARECCEPYDCSGGCGKKLPKKDHRTCCDECWNQKQEAKEQAAYEKARKVPYEEYTGEMIFDGDEYFHDMDSLVDAYDSDDREVPEWVWGTSPEAFQASAEDVIEGALQEHYEGASDEISDAARKELQTFLDAWCAARKITSYQQDMSTVVLVPERYRQREAQ